MPRSYGVVFIVALALWVLLGVLVSDALGSHVSCGKVITQDTTLDSDLLDCPGDGIVIGAPGITLDLDGHVVDGDGDPGRRPGCDTGIVNGRFDSCSGQVVGHDGVTVRNGTVQEFAHGVQVIIADRNSLLRLHLEHNTGFGGIATFLMTNGRIEGNRAFGNRSAGIAVYEPGGRTTITGNLLGRNSGHGIELAGSAPGDRLEDNVTFANTGAGFNVSGARGLLVRGNRSSANAVGMNFWDGVSDTRVVGNRLWSNGFAGISIEEGSHRNRIEGNAVFRNAYASSVQFPGGGITLSNGDDNRITGNRVLDNGGDGGIVFGAESRGDVVASNHVAGNAGHGILLGVLYEDAGGAIVSGNHVVRNGEDGIHVREESLDPETHIEVSEVWGNHTDRNGDDGIDVRSDKVAVAANRAAWNADLGIDAVAGVTDGGGNRARWNGNPLQCVNVFCR
jgi:parallel beta-helix repeat protein